MQQSEDLEFIWTMRLLEIERQMSDKPPIYSLYEMIFKYGAKVSSQNMGSNKYEINLLFQPFGHFSFITEPEKCKLIYNKLESTGITQFREMK
jgi:hypothetical protein